MNAKVVLIAVLAVLLIPVVSYGQEEEITLSTYYPAPYGVYKELTTTSNTYLATEEGNVGIGIREPNSDAPNGTKTGNLDVNDIYLRSVPKWVSQAGLPTRIIEGEFSDIDGWTEIPNSKGAAICLLSRLYDDTDYDLGAGFYECEIKYDEEQREWIYRAPQPKEKVCCGYICLFVE